MDLPALVFPPDPSLPPVPDEAACVRLWDKYGMLPNIRAHSRTVARVALDVAERAVALGHTVDVPALRAAALLHDLAKTYTILHGGAHGCARKRAVPIWPGRCCFTSVGPGLKGRRRWVRTPCACLCWCPTRTSALGMTKWSAWKSDLRIC